jgi:hypothetical protein
MPAAIFYVYRIFDITETTIYIGKGTGRRLERQMRRFGAQGEILKRFKFEDDAFEFERAEIRRRCPTHNKSTGGEGGRLDGRDKTERLMDKIGPRRYVAQMLMRFGDGLLKYIDQSKLDAIRQVADGPRI